MDPESRESLELALSETYYRFLYTLPEDEQESMRYMVHLRHGYWYYADNLMKKFKLHNMKFREFVKLMKDRFKFLPGYSVSELMENYAAYSQQIPVRGAILLNDSLTKVLMVKASSGRSYAFPKGKINEDESDERCAVREVLEEVGYNISANLNPQEFIQTTLCKLYLVTGVPEDFPFQTRTVGGIANIEWIDLDQIPWKSQKPTNMYKSYNFYKVHEVLPQLRKWVRAKRLVSVDCVGHTSHEFLERFKHRFSHQLWLPKPFKLDAAKVHQRLSEFLSFN